MMYDEDLEGDDDMLDTTPSKKAKPKAVKKAAKAGTEAKKAAKRPSKAVTTKPKSNGKAKPEKKAKPKKAADDDVSTIQPEDKVVLAAVRKLRQPTLASEFAADLGVHRRVIRHQLQRLAKDKGNGVKMVKEGYNWVVSQR